MDILKMTKWEMQTLTFVLLGIIFIFNTIFEGLELESVKMFYMFSSHYVSSYHAYIHSFQRDDRHENNF